MIFPFWLPSLKKPPSRPPVYLIHSPEPRLTQRMLPCLPFLLQLLFYTNNFLLGAIPAPGAFLSTHDGSLTSSAAAAKHDHCVLILKTTKWSLKLSVSSGHLCIPVEDPTHQAGHPHIPHRGRCPAGIPPEDTPDPGGSASVPPLTTYVVTPQHSGKDGPTGVSSAVSATQADGLRSMPCHPQPGPCTPRLVLGSAVALFRCQCCVKGRLSLGTHNTHVHSP